jgi:hypothetical protein
MSLVEKQITFAINVSRLIQHINSSGYFCTLGEAFRTPEQAEIYAKQRKGIKDSQHCKRLAIDLNLFSPDAEYLKDFKSYEKFGLYWESLDKRNRWGGLFKTLIDSNHFEMKD